MSSAAARRVAMPPIELLEEAVGLLRQAPAAAWLAYVAGAVPFWLGALYFLADMSRNAFARDRLLGESLVLALLFLGLKCGQAIFCGHLRAALAGTLPPPWTVRRALRIVSIQAAIQPWGFLIRPIALIVTLPWVWVSNFYHNVTVLGDMPTSERLGARAWSVAKLWPGQAHAIAGVLGLASLFAWLNVVVAMLVAPYALRMLAGVETAASQSFLSMFNSTFFGVSFAVTFAAMDPLWKAAATLRCFYGEALETGGDLRARLRALSAAAAALLVGAAIILPGAPVHAALREAAPTAQVAPPAAIDEAITRVLERPEFSWRAPRAQRAAATNGGWFSEFVGGIWNSVTGWISGVWNWLLEVLRKLFDQTDTERKPGWSPASIMDTLLWVMIGIAVAAAAWFGWRMRHWRPGPRTLAEAVAATPVDLTRENVTADLLPEEGWIALARDLWARGELRLAMRAWYLAGLALLGRRELLRLARHKTNREYRNELVRRAPILGAAPAVVAAFEENLRTFERSWYGEHPVTSDLLDRCSANLEAMQSTP